MNAVLLAVIVMVGLSLARVHVVLSLVIGALIGGLVVGLSVADPLSAFPSWRESLLSFRVCAVPGLKSQRSSGRGAYLWFTPRV